MVCTDHGGAKSQRVTVCSRDSMPSLHSLPAPNVHCAAANAFLITKLAQRWHDGSQCPFWEAERQVYCHYCCSLTRLLLDTDTAS